MARPTSVWLYLFAVYSFWVSLAHALSGQEPLKGAQEGYKAGEKIPVSCLNRTMYVYTLMQIMVANANILVRDTGEHVCFNRTELLDAK